LAIILYSKKVSYHNIALIFSDENWSILKAATANLKKFAVRQIFFIVGGILKKKV
jgi:hypothetical protein